MLATGPTSFSSNPNQPCSPLSAIFSEELIAKKLQVWHIKVEKVLQTEVGIVHAPVMAKWHVEKIDQTIRTLLLQNNASGLSAQVEEYRSFYEQTDAENVVKSIRDRILLEIKQELEDLIPVPQDGLMPLCFVIPYPQNTTRLEKAFIEYKTNQHMLQSVKGLKAEIQQLSLLSASFELRYKIYTTLSWIPDEAQLLIWRDEFEEIVQQGTQNCPPDAAIYGLPSKIGSGIKVYSCEHLQRFEDNIRKLKTLSQTYEDSWRRLEFSGLPPVLLKIKRIEEKLNPSSFYKSLKEHFYNGWEQELNRQFLNEAIFEGRRIFQSRYIEIVQSQFTVPHYAWLQSDAPLKELEKSLKQEFSKQQNIWNIELEESLQQFNEVQHVEQLAEILRQMPQSLLKFKDLILTPTVRSDMKLCLKYFKEAIKALSIQYLNRHLIRCNTIDWDNFLEALSSPDCGSLKEAQSTLLKDLNFKAEDLIEIQTLKKQLSDPDLSYAALLQVLNNMDNLLADPANLPKLLLVECLRRIKTQQEALSPFKAEISAPEANAKYQLIAKFTAFLNISYFRK